MIFNSDITFSNEAKQVQETSYKFLERSSWNRCKLARTLISMWMKDLTDDLEFISQIRSKSDKQHDAAIFELIVYTFLSKQGLTVDKHPILSKATTPDFIAKSDTVALMLLECTLSSNSFDSTEEERRKEAVEDIIRQIHYYPYFINLGFKRISKISVTPKKLKRFIEQIRISSEGFENEQLFHRKFLYKENEWEIEISLLKKSNNEIKTSLGAVFQDAKIIDSKKAILTALNDKRPSKYGISDTPYVICICVNDMFFHTNEMYSVLFGNDCGTHINLTFPGSSGFLYHNKPVNTSVSAVILFKNTDILTLGSAEWSVWHNPFAKNPLELKSLPIDEYHFTIEGNRLLKRVINKNANVFELLHVDELAYNTDPKGTHESC